MKQFLIAIALTMSITIGVSAQVPDNISSREESSLIINVDASMAATGRILGVK
ncbi:MAG TPA: hypothetical protein VFB99_16300 [Vicinamibacterales bacterium]|nr:hypothetical protein [Vicinamibacterales bacterium]